jgi:glycosyltransferase involved in cell wall biosynthesis
MFRWHIITGEYPPQPGGVSDYTRIVAGALANAGDEVDVWAPDGGEPQVPQASIRVHRLPGHFGPRALAIIGRAVAGTNCERVLVQYVPHAFGFKAMNLPFSYWLYTRRLWNITVMFHEVAFQRRVLQPVRHNLLGEVTSLMAMLVTRSAKRIFVSCRAWEEQLRALVGGLNAIEWLPIPSTVPLVNDPEATEAIRVKYRKGGRLVGHFSTYGPKIRKYLEMAIPELLRDRRVSVVLLGRGGDSFREVLMERHPAVASRLHATDELRGEDLSRHLSACDLMIQPYPDGISARRTSAMAALAHGRPVVTTVGRLTEPLWAQSGAVELVACDNPKPLLCTVTELLEDETRRMRLGDRARQLYRQRFDLSFTVAGLRAA